MTASLVERAEVLREKGTNRSRFFRGEVDKYTWVDLGSNYLASEIQAAYLLAQLRASDLVQSMRTAIWNRYDAALQDWARANGVDRPTVPPHCEQPVAPVLPADADASARARLIEHLKAQGILAVFHYIPLSLSPMGRRFGGTEGACPVAEDVERAAVAAAVLHEPERRTIRTTSSPQFSSSACDGARLRHADSAACTAGRRKTARARATAPRCLSCETTLLDRRRHRRADRGRRRSRLPGGTCRSRGQRRAAPLLVRRQKRRHPLDDTPRHRPGRGADAFSTSAAEPASSPQRSKEPAWTHGASTCIAPRSCTRAPRIRGPLFSNHATTLPFFRDFASGIALRRHRAPRRRRGRDTTGGDGPEASRVCRRDSAGWAAPLDEVRRGDRPQASLRSTGPDGCSRNAGLEMRATSATSAACRSWRRWFSGGSHLACARPSSDTIEIVRQALTVPPEPLNALFRWSIRAEAPLQTVVLGARGLAHRRGAPLGLTPAWHARRQSIVWTGDGFQHRQRERKSVVFECAGP